MSTKPKSLPHDCSTVTPYLIIKNADKALAFYKKVFGATEVMRLADDSGKICHAQLRIGESTIMLAEEFPEMNAHGPQKFGGSPITMHLYVDDVDSVFDQAIKAGATVLRPVKDQFYGDRSGGITDPFGHAWYIATRIENLTEEQLTQRFQEMKSTSST